MKTPKPNRIADLMRESTTIEKAMEEAIQETLRSHKLLGDPIVVWRDGKVVWVPPEQIELAAEANGPPANGPTSSK